MGQLGLLCVNPGVGVRLPSKAAKLCFEQSAWPLLRVPQEDALLYVEFASFAGSQVLHPTWLAGSQDTQGLAQMGRGWPSLCLNAEGSALQLWGELNEPLLGQPRQNGVKTIATHRNPLRLGLVGRRAPLCHAPMPCTCTRACL